jgi:gluconate 2-dehydrogenase gamma chain
MPRLRLRLVARHPSSPAELVRAAAPPPLVLLGRRQFVRGLALVLGALATPWTGARRAWARARGRFFTAHERATLEALVDRIIPPDADPGAKGLGAARYIEQLLTAFDHRPARIFAGGPFSGRAPFPDERTGTPSPRRPRDDFRHFIPLSRLEELRWRAELFGSASVRELPPALVAQRGGPLVGLRDVYREGLAKVDEVARVQAGAPFAALSAPMQDDVFEVLDGGTFAPDPARGGMTFIDILIRHTLEGCFCPPEYGGNQDRLGWRMLGIEGDVQPLGYSIFSRELGTYRERPGQPVSGPDPDDVGPDGTLQPKPLGDAAESVVTFIVKVTGALGTICPE